MTRYQVLAKMQEVLAQFAKEDTTNSSVEVHIVFDLVGDIVPANSKQEMWWDENLMMWIPQKPE